jgi:hypothetical protein
MANLLSEILRTPGVVFWGSVTLICVVPSICHYWHKARRDEVDAQLKDAMIARGMSADEIVRVLEAGRPSSESAQSKTDPVTA